jgi:hypothetical protein
MSPSCCSLLFITIPCLHRDTACHSKDLKFCDLENELEQYDKKPEQVYSVVFLSVLHDERLSITLVSAGYQRVITSVSPEYLVDIDRKVDTPLDSLMYTLSINSISDYRVVM